MGLTGKSNHRANIFFGRRGCLHFVHCTKPNHPFLSGVFSNMGWWVGLVCHLLGHLKWGLEDFESSTCPSWKLMVTYQEPGWENRWFDFRHWWRTRFVAGTETYGMWARAVGRCRIDLIQFVRPHKHSFILFLCWTPDLEFCYDTIWLFKIAMENPSQMDTNGGFNGKIIYKWAIFHG